MAELPAEPAKPCPFGKKRIPSHLANLSVLDQVASLRDVMLALEDAGEAGSLNRTSIYFHIIRFHCHIKLYQVHFDLKLRLCNPQVKVALSHHHVDLGNATCERQKPLVFMLDAKPSNEPTTAEEPPKKKLKKTKKGKDKDKDKKAFFALCHHAWKAIWLAAIINGSQLHCCPANWLLTATWLAANKTWQPAGLLPMRS